jgi:hypothetical protein
VLCRISERIPSVQKPVKRVLDELKVFALIYPFANKTVSLYRALYKLLKLQAASADSRNERVVRIIDKVDCCYY